MTNKNYLTKKSKRKLQYLSKLYDELYFEGKEIIEMYNPCEIKKHIITGIVTCLDSKENPYRDESCLCCTGCKYLTKNGCGVKSLACKLWYCTELYAKYPKVASKLSSLSSIAQRNGLWHYRMSKQDIFKYLVSVELKEQEVYKDAWKMYDKSLFPM